MSTECRAPVMITVALGIKDSRLHRKAALAPAGPAVFEIVDILEPVKEQQLG